MITLHRLSHAGEVLHLNPDLIERCEANPDTAIVLTTGKTIVVRESPAEVSDAVRAWRVQILREALDGR